MALFVYPKFTDVILRDLRHGRGGAYGCHVFADIGRGGVVFFLDFPLWQLALGQLDDFNGVPFKHSGDGGVVVHAHGDVFVLRTANRLEIRKERIKWRNDSIDIL